MLAGIGYVEPRGALEVPRIRIPGVGEERLDVGGNRATARVDRTHAHRAVERNLLVPQELAAGLQIVSSLRVVRHVVVVSSGPDVLQLVAGIVRVPRNR